MLQSFFELIWDVFFYYPPYIVKVLLLMLLG